MISAYRRLEAEGHFGKNPYPLLFGVALATYKSQVNPDHFRGEFHCLLGMKPSTTPSQPL